MTLRVKDASVVQIPAIAFSWFDPYEEQFATATSRPIALQVMETQVVSAADVISSSPNAKQAAGGANGPSDSDAGTAASLSERGFVGANLAIVRDPARLLAGTSTITAPATITAGCYALAVVLVLGSLTLRRRAARDKEQLRRRKLVGQWLSQITRAERLPAQQATSEIAQTLRDLIAESEMQHREEADQLIASCDNIVYATGAVLDAEVPEIAAVARRIVQEAAMR